MLLKKDNIMWHAQKKKPLSTLLIYKGSLSVSDVLQHSEIIRYSRKKYNLRVIFIQSFLQATLCLNINNTI